MLSAGVSKALGALFKIPLTNLLGGVGMSYFSCAYSLFMPVYALTVTGLSSAVARMTAQSVALGMYSNAKKIRSTALMIFSAVGLAGSILTFILSLLFGGSAESTLSVAMISPSVFFGCIMSVERGYYEGMSNMYPTAVSQVIEGVVKVVAGLCLCGYITEHIDEIIVYFPDIDPIAVSSAGGILGVTLSSVGAVVFFAVLRFFRKGIPENSEKTLMSRKDISRELIANAVPTGISAVVTNLTALIDMWTVIGCITYFGSRTNQPSGIAEKDIPNFIYGSFAGIALTVFNLVPSVTNMLGKGVLPCITEAWENHRIKTLSENTMQALITSAVIAVPSAFGIAVLAPEILVFLFPKQPEEVNVCINSLRLLMVGMVCLCVSFPVFSMLQAIGKASLPLKIMLLGTLVKFAGNILLIPFMGVDGASVSTSVCYAVILIVSVKLYVKHSGISLKIAPFALILYAGGMCAGSAYLACVTAHRYGMGSFGVLAVSVVTGGIVYLAVLAVCGSCLKRSGKLVFQ
ncbi:MAG: polysaccharide biosynthesis C-terminal domain-containing protein [Ruminococcus sp.]|nr:polysaccharide biosynthesis C-terminal domain-containing protein [Ruminococcus sp.]MDE6678863.1 polysaccharide biosynthesis C-terminal domain-containing protein [Ruminococcus sp.]